MERSRRDDEANRPDNEGDGGFSADDFPGREILSGGDPMKILERLHQDDALELWPRCAAHISDQAVLLQIERLYLRLTARLAYAAPRYRGKPPLGNWISDRMEVSLRELLSDDREAERRELPIGLEQDPRYVFLSKTLGIELGLAPRVCNRFNSLSHDQRAVFFGVMVEGRGIQGYARERGLPLEQVRDSLAGVIRAIGVRSKIDLRRFEWGEGILPEGGDAD